MHGFLLQSIGMSSYKDEETTVFRKIYDNETIAHFMSNLLEGTDNEVLVSSDILLLSSLEEIMKSTSDKKRLNATEVLLCLLASISDVPEEMCKTLLDLCQSGNLDKKLLYYALVARPELDTLSTFLNYERPFLRQKPPKNKRRLQFGAE
ncbi:Anhydro-N-acetylmuramic acid kinase [Frankliniella fusca]|uniref:Anhydro-N-acetylmuramic acid kinase n=1 Tax=Frankliniella fusca TaxID=407009 RepID=A0AAE1H0D7_9NEOP|nr:Anhydro-N-acetylmuramic acid kinase [Frankliniella fusca]